MKKVGTTLAVFAFLVGSLFTAAPAQAADGWVYVVVNDRVCNALPGTNLKARGIIGNVTPTSWTSTRWDRGDNIIYPKVRLGIKNTATLSVECYKKPAWYLPYVHVGFAHVQQSFTPKFHNQTIWLG